MKTKEALDIIKNTYSIEYGGCGIAALAFYRWLKKRCSSHRLEFVYCYISRQKKEFLSNKQTEAFNDGEIKIPAHIMLMSNGVIIDPCGNFSITDFKYFQVIATESFLLKSINTEGWNYMFYRGYAIELAEKLDIDLSDINIQLQD